MRLPIRIAIADDHALFRQGLQSLLKHEPQVTVAGETGRADDVRALVERTSCDLLLLDLQMDRNSLVDVESLSACVPVIVLTASELPADALAAVRLGARAVVFKRFAVETLMDAIRSVAEGNAWLPPSLQTQLATRLRDATNGTGLSTREEEVVRYVALGLRNAEVAEKLAITEPTIKTHLNSIFRKLGIRDRVELTLYAARAGLIRIP
jgi:DNA-binding NarL/FixJ family response regulator